MYFFFGNKTRVFLCLFAQPTLANSHMTAERGAYGNTKEMRKVEKVCEPSRRAVECVLRSMNKQIRDFLSLFNVTKANSICIIFGISLEHMWTRMFCVKFVVVDMCEIKTANTWHNPPPNERWKVLPQISVNDEFSIQFDVLQKTVPLDLVHLPLVLEEVVGHEEPANEQ